MQAPQSNNADHLPHPDLHSGLPSGSPSNGSFLPGIPSPFTAPIKAARRYLERQRGDLAQAADGPAVRDHQPLSHQPLGHQLLGRELVRQELLMQEQQSREQDRRLERSLYEANAIETDLSSDASDASDASGKPHVSDAYDEPNALWVPLARDGEFSAAAPAPEAVRGAIQRLTRESEFARSWSKETTGSGICALTPSFLESQTDPAPLDFAEVARRVWKRDADLIRESTTLDRTVSDAVVELAPVQTVPVQMMPVQMLSVQMLSVQMLSAQDLAERQAVEPFATDLQSDHAALQPPAALDSAIGCAEQGQALAHDARNLLLALGLYSDLLRMPGVLHEEHRHYAEELHLMATRSQSLIDRLLRVAAGPASALSGKDLMPNPTSEMARPGGGGTAYEISAAASPLEHEGDDDASDSLNFKVCLIPSQATAVQAAEDAAEGTTDAAALTNTGLDSSENSAQQQVSLVDLLMRWGSLLSTLAHGNIEVVFGSHAATPVAAPSEAIERILVNLVRNAKAATAAGGAIRITAGVAEKDRAAGPMDANPAGDMMALTVDDSGRGMTPEEVRRVLGGAANTGPVCTSDIRSGIPSDGYGLWPGSGQSLSESVLDDTLTSPPETIRNLRQSELQDVGLELIKGGRRCGLGLRIVRELVAATGGTLGIQSLPGRGTRVEIRWPINLAPTAESVSGGQEPGRKVIGREDKEREDSAQEDTGREATRWDGTGWHETGLHAQAAFQDSQQRCAESIAPTGAAAEIQPVLLPMPQPQAVQSAVDDDGTGPDGFSETELRAMMLRLHRASPGERAASQRQTPPHTLGHTDGKLRPDKEEAYSVRLDKAVQLDEVMRPDERDAVAHGFGPRRSVAGGVPVEVYDRETPSTKGAVAC